MEFMEKLMILNITLPGHFNTGMYETKLTQIWQSLHVCVLVSGKKTPAAMEYVCMFRIVHI